MSMPRILPLVGIAIAGVLAINALAGASDLPALLTGARAFAEEAVKAAKPEKGKKGDKAGEAAGETAPTGEAKDAVASTLGLPPTAPKPQAVCAPTAAELAKEAGLSPAELQVLQNLGERRGQLDQRENQMDVQLALLAAAEAKLDAKVKALGGLKIDIQNLLSQANTKQDQEIDRLVKVFEGMKPKDSAARMMVLEDAVRIPIAAKMKDRALSAMLAQMPPAEAKKITELLARRFAAAQQQMDNVNAQLSAAKGETDPTKLAQAQSAGPDAAAPKAAKKPVAKRKKPAAKPKPKPEGDPDDPASATG